MYGFYHVHNSFIRGLSILIFWAVEEVSFHRKYNTQCSSSTLGSTSPQNHSAKQTDLRVLNNRDAQHTLRPQVLSRRIIAREDLCRTDGEDHRAQQVLNS